MAVTDRVPQDGTQELPPRVAKALEMAAISPARRGTARRAGLSGAERELYYSILRGFAAYGRPSSVELREITRRLGLDADQALATLAREDLVHVGSDGEVTVAYPFSGRPTAHRVRFPDGRETYAMCAIDALGIAPMFGQTIEIRSQDPWNADEIEVRATPEAPAKWQPKAAVVVAGVVERDGDSCDCCCPVLNFFASPVNARQWVAEHPGVRGEVISVPDAFLAGRAVFGRVFEEA
jgi:Alkylmercury lyase